MRHHEEVFAGIMTVVLAGAIIGLAAAVKHEAKPVTVETELQNIQTINNDPEAVTIAELTYYEPIYDAAYPVTSAERERIARIVAGKAVDQRQTCQRMVANVIYNDMKDCGGDLDKAIRRYGLNSDGEPTADTYAAVDEIFNYGMFMLDEDVLFFNDKNHNSPFHDELEIVCENDGIVFYRVRHTSREVTK